MATPHRYWRVRGYIQNDSVMAGEYLEMRTTRGGSTVCTGGTAISSPIYGGGYEAANMFVDNGNAWATAISDDQQYIGYDFGAGNEKDIIEIAFRARSGAPSQAPAAIAIEFSDDGTTWASYFYHQCGAWSGAEVKIAAVPTSFDRGPNPRRFWRIDVTSSFNAYIRASEIEFSTTVGGANVNNDASFIATAKDTYSGFRYLPRMFDGIGPSGDVFIWNGTTNPWLQFDFGLFPITFDQFHWYGGSSEGDQFPKSGIVSYSDDGVNWTFAWDWDFLAYPTTPSVGALAVHDYGGPARYWRIFIDQTMNPDRHCHSATRVTFRGTVGGADLTGSGTAIANDSSFGAAANAYTANDDIWHDNCGGATAWIGYDFGDGHDVLINEVSYRSRNDGFYGPQDSPKFGRVQYSHDGVTWHTAWKIPSQQVWAAAETRVWSRTAAPAVDAGGHRYWRVRCGDYGRTGGLDGVSRIQMFRAGDTVPYNLIGYPVDPPSRQAGSSALVMHADSDTSGLIQFSTSDATSEWAGYDFGPGYQPRITRIRISPNRDDSNRSWREMYVEYSDDGTTWHTFATMNPALPWSSASQEFVFDKTQGYPILRSTQTDSYNQSGGIFTIPLPHGAVVGDSCYLFISGSAAFTAPTGWVAIDALVETSGWFSNIFTRILDSTDITAGSIVVGSGGYAAWTLIAFNGPVMHNLPLTEQNSSVSNGGTSSLLSGAYLANNFVLFFASVSNYTTVAGDTGQQIGLTGTGYGASCLLNGKLELADGQVTSTNTFPGGGYIYQATLVLKGVAFSLAPKRRRTVIVF